MEPIYHNESGLVSSQERYRPIAKLGAGGMADVFLGVQLSGAGFERLLVIKKISAQEYKNDHSIQMFIDEARIIASLNHPHVVKVYDLSRVRDQICITMEYIDGETLEYVLRALKNAKKTIPLPIVCKIMIEALEALHYAHSVKSPDGTPLNLVHRDIGAQNLMIDSQGYLKVIDFGIAKSTVQTEFTLPGLIKGKLAYLAPDVFKFKDIDGRVDLYAMGLVLYELVTMQHPFSFGSETSMPEIINSILQDSIRPPREINASLPSELEDIVCKAADKNREKRYQTGEEFARALYDFADKHDGIASTLDVKNWFQTEFKQRIEQRRKFEQLVQEKADRIKRKTTNSGIISLPVSLQFEQQPATLPKLQPPPQPAGIVIASKHTNPYLIAAMVFVLFIGVMIAVQQLFLSSNPDKKEITLALDTVNSQASQSPSQLDSALPTDTKSKASAISSASVSVAPRKTEKAPTVIQPKPSPTPVPAILSGHPATPTNRPALVSPEAGADTEIKNGPTPTAESDSALALVDKPGPPPEKPAPVASRVAAELPKKDQPIPTEEPVAIAGNKPSQKSSSDQSSDEPKKPVAVATINLLSGNGNWNGEQVAMNGCVYCHPMDWSKKTKNQWVRFISRGLHNRHRDLRLYFSEGEIDRLTGYISTKEKESGQPRGIAGTN